MLSQVTSLFLLEFGAGTLAFMVFMPLRDLKNTFFMLNGGISLLFLIFFFLLSPFCPNKTLLAACLVFLVISYLIFILKKYLLSRIALILSTAVAFIIVFTRGMSGISSALPLTVQISGGVSLLLGAALLGVCYGTMILGHWYLVTPSLPFRYLVNSSRIFIGITILRTLVLGSVMAAFYWLLGSETKGLVENLISFDQLGLFFLMRIFWGIFGPLILSFMILETAKIRHNQAATGILYVACIFVFIGELCAAYLFQMGGFPA
ncbi:MAG: hypothetical protein HZC17_05435 [Candidatus Omnitrophica bacterium]|nr:hypothetical protein [Candidatus Omnitrophota bacterium]